MASNIIGSNIWWLCQVFQCLSLSLLYNVIDQVCSTLWLKGFTKCLVGISNLTWRVKTCFFLVPAKVGWTSSLDFHQLETSLRRKNTIVPFVYFFKPAAMPCWVHQVPFEHWTFATFGLGSTRTGDWRGTPIANRKGPDIESAYRRIDSVKLGFLTCGSKSCWYLFQI